jgi:outer membrane protein assembly factor BamB
MTSVRILAGTLILAGIVGIAYAGDSPQFRGPHRDGIFEETGLLKEWPAGGPPVAWVAKGLGQGYSSPVVVNGKIYVLGMFEELNSFIIVLDMDGKIERKIPYGKEIETEEANGARSTPTIDGNRLYLLSAPGVIYCIDLTTDKTLWSVNILERFKAKNNEWSIVEPLLVDGDRVICTPGGPDAGMAALNKMTGETLWTTKGLSDMASYVPPTIAEHNGRRILLTETSTLVVGVDAGNGALLWTHPHKTEWDIHAVTPIYKDGLVYYTAGYGSGGGVLELSKDGASVTQKWTDKTLDCQHHGVVLVNGYLFGTGHRKQQLTCLEMQTGKVMWFSKEIKQGSLVCADGMLYIYEGPKSGIVSLVKAVPTGFERTGTFTVTEGTNQHWSHPTIAHGRLYIHHGDALIAYDVKAK